MKVMIVDDNASVRAFFREQLEQSEIEVVEYASGIAAVHAYRTEAPDAVLMDIVMPGMDGFEATERLRDLDEDACIYIVTDYGDEEFRSTALQLGARDFYQKDQVMELIRNLKANSDNGRHHTH